ncbi:amino acid ABC transporter ATP-binding protein [Fusibacter sp. JL298sf-3]
MRLKLDQLVKRYDDKTILRGIDLDFSDISVLALIGASGSGKSTLLRLIAGLELFDGGAITVNGRTLSQGDDPEYRKKVGFVFQDHNLFSHLSIRENIYLVLEKVHGKKRAEVEAKVDGLLTQFGLLEHADKKPHQISGGQSQRASIVRALAIEPEIILLDEPTSSLDPVLTYEVLTAVKKLAEQKVDFIIVTHEIGFAKRVADKTVFMEDGQVVEVGGSEMFDVPKTAQLQNFLEKIVH